MHYLIQATLAELEAASVAWKEHGGGRYVAHYAKGMVVIAGPRIIGNPNKTWWEIQCENPELVADLAKIGNEMSLMKTEMRRNGLLQASYRVSGRTMMRNSRGKIIGVLPAFEICGRGLEASFLAGEDPEEAEEITGLE